jgi:hypothetical protein
MQRRAGVASPNAKLNGIIGTKALASIAKLTVGFLLCFFALRIQRLCIKKTSRVLTRGGQRWKSTLCKLYQVAHILEAAGILERCDTDGEVSLINRYFVPIEIQVAENGVSPFGLDSILNRKRPGEEIVALQRQVAFEAEAAKPQKR